MPVFEYTAFRNERFAANGVIVADTPEDALLKIKQLDQDQGLHFRDFVEGENPDHFLIVDGNGGQHDFEEPALHLDTHGEAVLIALENLYQAFWRDLVRPAGGKRDATLLPQGSRHAGGSRRDCQSTGAVMTELTPSLHYDYEPYTRQDGAEIPAFRIYQDGEPIADTNENLSALVQERAAILFCASYELRDGLANLVGMIQLGWGGHREGRHEHYDQAVALLERFPADSS